MQAVFDPAAPSPKLASRIVLVDVTLAIEVPVDSLDYADGYVSDAVNEILRDQQQCYVATSCLLDYQHGDQRDCLAIAENYSEGDAFCDSARAPA